MVFIVLIKIQIFAGMAIRTTVVVAEAVQHIINQGKEVLQTHLISREKIPPYANKSASSNYQQIVAHGGYQTQNFKKYSHFTLKKDPMPVSVGRDSLAIKSQQAIQRPKSLIKTSPILKFPHQKFYSSKKKNKPISASYHLDSSPKQKQNHEFVKIKEKESNRIVIERVRQRLENEEDSMREKKRLQMLKQYEEKLQNEAFQKTRQDRQADKERQLEEHLKKGESFNFNFDHEGELILFETNDHKKFVPPQAIFKIHTYNEESGKTQEAQLKFQRSSASHNDNVHPLQRQSRDNQRIRSARGEAFASAVMKTVNLSRISMNGSYLDVDPQHFMKRNDLFNNNHSRQTTSIPYLQPKIGTVYTEVATNQVASSKEPRSSTTALAKEDRSVSSREGPQKQKGFEGFYQYNDRKYARTARVFRNRDDQGEDLIKESSRPIKTAKQSGGSMASSQRRPQTTTYRGRITAANQKLVQSLLQQ